MRGVAGRPPALASVPPEVAALIFKDIAVATYGERMAECNVCEVLREWGLCLGAGAEYPDGHREPLPPQDMTGARFYVQNGRLLIHVPSSQEARDGYDRLARDGDMAAAPEAWAEWLHNQQEAGNGR